MNGCWVSCGASQRCFRGSRCCCRNFGGIRACTEEPHNLLPIVGLGQPSEAIMTQFDDPTDGDMIQARPTVCSSRYRDRFNDPGFRLDSTSFLQRIRGGTADIALTIEVANSKINSANPGNQHPHPATVPRFLRNIPRNLFLPTRGSAGEGARKASYYKYGL